MKRLLPIILVVLASSCTRNLTDLNDDPKSSRPRRHRLRSLPPAKKALVDIYSADNWSAAPFRVIAQVWTMNTYNNITHYNFATDNPSGGWWTAIYTNAPLWQPCPRPKRFSFRHRCTR